MQRLEVSGVVRHIYESLGVKRLRLHPSIRMEELTVRPWTIITSETS